MTRSECSEETRTFVFQVPIASVNIERTTVETIMRSRNQSAERSLRCRLSSDPDQIAVVVTVRAQDMPVISARTLPVLTVRLKAPIDPPQPRGFEGALGTDTTESIRKMVNLIVSARRTNHTASALG